MELITRLWVYMVLASLSVIGAVLIFLSLWTKKSLRRTWVPMQFLAICRCVAMVKWWIGLVFGLSSTDPLSFWRAMPAFCVTLGAFELFFRTAYQCWCLCLVLHLLSGQRGLQWLPRPGTQHVVSWAWAAVVTATAFLVPHAFNAQGMGWDTDFDCSARPLARIAYWATFGVVACSLITAIYNLRHMKLTSPIWRLLFFLCMCLFGELMKLLFRFLNLMYPQQPYFEYVAVLIYSSSGLWEALLWFKTPRMSCWRRRGMSMEGAMVTSEYGTVGNSSWSSDLRPDVGGEAPVLAPPRMESEQDPSSGAPAEQRGSYITPIMNVETPQQPLASSSSYADSRESSGDDGYTFSPRAAPLALN